MRVLFLNRSYWPDAEATGQLLTELCEDLAPQFEVAVIAGQPNQNPDGESYRAHGSEPRRGVTIHRVPHTRFSKRSLLGRGLNLLSFACLALWTAWRVPRPDVIVVETDPPLLCLVGWLIKRLRGCRFVVYIQDIHPDIGLALGKLRPSPLIRLLRNWFVAAYRAADRVVVLSGDMRAHLKAFGISDDRMRTVPNWVDTRSVVPLKSNNAFRAAHGLTDRFVVMYSGNLGLTQSFDDLLAAAEVLREEPEIQFVIIGHGASRERLEAEVKSRAIDNVRFLDFQPRSELANSLSAADVQVVLLDPRLTGLLMPSKLYGILAVATPVLALAPEDSELAQIVLRHEVGYVVPPERSGELAARIREMCHDRRELARRGKMARELAEREYSRESSVSRFAAVLEELSPALTTSRPLVAAKIETPIIPSLTEVAS